MAFDLALPAAGGGVVDELLFDGEAGSKSGGVVAGGEELRTGEHEVAFARAFDGCAQAVAEFEFGLEEVSLQPGHGLWIEAVLAQGLSGGAGEGDVGSELAVQGVLVLLFDGGVGQALWRSRILQLSECLSLASPGDWFGGLGGGLIAAAVVGGVGGPVSAAGALPSDGDADVDAEHAREHGGGQLGCQLEQCGGAGWSGLDADLAQSFGEAEGADGPSGLAAWEQPRRGALVAEGGVATSGGDELLDQRGDRLGEDYRLASELEACLGAAGLDVVEGESADRGCRLRVEQDEQSGGTVFWFEGVVVQQPTGLFPAGFGVDAAGRSAPSDRREVQCCQFLLVGPPDEVASAMSRGRLAGRW